VVLYLSNTLRVRWQLIVMQTRSELCTTCWKCRLT